MNGAVGLQQAGLDQLPEATQVTCAFEKEAENIVKVAMKNRRKRNRRNFTK